MLEYLYLFNYPPNNEELAKLEMRSLFKEDTASKYLFTNVDYNPSHSPYIKSKLKIIYQEATLSSLLNNILKDNFSLESYKVSYLKSNNDVLSHEERIYAVKEVGYLIDGIGTFSNYQYHIGICYINEHYILGYYTKNDYLWHNHDHKPYSYSNALSIRLARSLINIATSNDYSVKIVDPCCGIGSVVLEGLSMGVNIIGYDISKKIVANAKANLEYFNFDGNNINSKDMHTIKAYYDVAILDIPYGLFSPTTKQVQDDLIIKAKTMAHRLIIITNIDLKNELTNKGLQLIDFAMVSKSNFKRYILVFE